MNLINGAIEKLLTGKAKGMTFQHTQDVFSGLGGCNMSLQVGATVKMEQLRMPSAVSCSQAKCSRKRFGICSKFEPMDFFSELVADITLKFQGRGTSDCGSGSFSGSLRFNPGVKVSGVVDLDLKADKKIANPKLSDVDFNRGEIVTEDLSCNLGAAKTPCKQVVSDLKASVDNVFTKVKSVYKKVVERFS